MRLAERDGYRLAGEIGRGPRSVVYRAVYVPLQQTVAVKVFAADLCPREAWEARLAEGAQLWQALAHPQIATVHRAGWWDGAGYVVTDYVPQGSLANRSPHAPREEPHRRPGHPSGGLAPVTTTLDLLVQLTELVNYLHRQGIVHGNLKPSNVLLAADGIPRLSDFRLTGGLFIGELPQTDSGASGLGYLAPELLADHAVSGSPVEPRPYTDIYGLGLILYELVAGRPPFVASGSDLVAQVRSQDPAPPSSTTATSHRRSTPFASAHFARIPGGAITAFMTC